MRAIDKRLIWGALAALVLLAGIGFGLSTRSEIKSKRGAGTAEVSEKQKERLADACASPSTYSRLKQAAFQEAVQIRNSDPTNLQQLATNSVVRMENPIVKSRDEELNVTVCTGRFVLELPPGAESGFGGQRRLVAEIEYAAHAAADGSGLVYQMTGAEPIIYRLAAFDLRNQPYRAPDAPAPTEFAEAPVAPEPAEVPAMPEPPSRPVAEPVPAPPPRPAPRPAPPESRPERREAAAPPAPRPPAPRPPEVREPVRAATTRPSFNCRSARTRSERMVCGSGSLAARDRAMSSLYYSAMADADSRTRAALRRTRDRFLAYRERCGSESCVAEAYEGRMAEIRDIMADSQ